MLACPNLLVVSDLLIGVAFSLALVWLVGATAFKTMQWLKSPSPLRIPITPAPRTRRGVLGRLLLELFAFRSLARANLVTWLASLAFHYGLLFVLIMHLRFVFPNLPLWLIPFIRWSSWAAGIMLLGLLVLLLRRCLVDRLRYISSPSDYLHVILLMGIGGSGMVLKRIWPTDFFAVGEFLRGALMFDWQKLPDHSGLLLHLALVLLLIIVFPISKLIHGIGIVFSPTLNQRDSAKQSKRV